MRKQIAITGQLVDIRNVATHKVARMVIDVPAEQAAGIVSMFGWPTMASPVPVAIARLMNPEAAAPATSGQEREVLGETKPPAPLQPSDKPERRKFEALPLPQQTGIRCCDPIFRKYVEELSGHQTNDEETASQFVRKYCNVESRADIRNGEASGKYWLSLERDYQAWRIAERVGALT